MAICQQQLEVCDGQISWTIDPEDNMGLIVLFGTLVGCVVLSGE